MLPAGPPGEGELQRVPDDQTVEGLPVRLLQVGRPTRKENQRAGSTRGISPEIRQEDHGVLGQFRIDLRGAENHQ